MEEEEEIKVQIPNLFTIPKSDLRSLFWKSVERVTGQRSLKKYISQGFVFTFFSGIPSIWSAYFRGRVYRKFMGSIGVNCLIMKNVTIRVPKRIFIGDRVFIGNHVCLDACYSTSKIKLENDVHIGRNSIIRAGIGEIIIHEGTVVNRLVYLDGNGGIEVGRNSLIGNKVEIISGSHIFDDLKNPY